MLSIHCRVAPEVLMHYPYTSSADVYSYGMVLWEMLSAKTPFSEENYSLKKLGEAVTEMDARPIIPRPNQSNWFDEQYIDLIERCWKKDPKERPTFDEIVGQLERMCKDLMGEGDKTDV